MPLTTVLEEVLEEEEEDVDDVIEEDTLRETVDNAAKEDVGAEEPGPDLPPAPPGTSDLLALTDGDNDPLTVGDEFTTLQAENVSDQEISVTEVFVPSCGGTIGIVILLWTLDPDDSAAYEFDCPQELTGVTDDPDAGTVDIDITTPSSGASTSTTTSGDTEEIKLVNDVTSEEPADVTVTQAEETLYDKQLTPGETDTVSVTAGEEVTVTIDGTEETFIP